MRETSRWKGTMGWMLALFVIAGWLLSAQPARSQSDKGQPPIKWEYNSTIVEANSLQAKVVELAADGWELLALNTAEQALDDRGDNKTRLVVEKYVVLGRRAQTGNK